jgi:hypothetical protein
LASVPARRLPPHSPSSRLPFHWQNATIKPQKVQRNNKKTTQHNTAQQAYKLFRTRKRTRSTK